MEMKYGKKKYAGHDEGTRKSKNTGGINYESPAVHEDLDKTPSRVEDAIQREST